MTTTAFALAGLGGFNAHGAGFLKAATDRHLVPDLVTATSGQIIVVADWLRGFDLRKTIVDAALENNPLAQVSIALSGDPGIFRPAIHEAILRWWTPPRATETPIGALLDRLLPAQVFVPTRSDADIERIADTLNNHAVVDGHEVGVVFNAYNLQTGQATLFGNAKGRSLWPTEKAIPLARRPQGLCDGEDPVTTAIQPITAVAVRSALWLSLYGFDRLPEPHLIDGAYHRSCLVAELHQFDTVFVARPLAKGWLGKPPRNYFEVQDWQTEMWFSVGYKAEVDALLQINGLVAQGDLGPPYKIVKLREVAPRTPAGFFNYFVEREAIFDRAYDEGIAAIAATAKDQAQNTA